MQTVQLNKEIKTYQVILKQKQQLKSTKNEYPKVFTAFRLHTTKK